MLLAKDTLWHLPKLADRNLSCLYLDLALVAREDIMLVALIVIEIIVLFGYLVGSLIPEDQINPEMKLFAHLRTLKGFSHFKNKLLRKTSPDW